VIITEDNELPSLNMEPGLSWSISHHQDTLLQFVLRYDVSSPILSYDMRSQIGIGHQATLSDSRPNS
jgi:hypothetical protein